MLKARFFIGAGERNRKRIIPIKSPTINFLFCRIPMKNRPLMNPSQELRVNVKIRGKSMIMPAANAPILTHLGTEENAKENVIKLTIIKIPPDVM